MAEGCQHRQGGRSAEGPFASAHAQESPCRRYAAVKLEQHRLALQRLPSALLSCLDTKVLNVP